MKFYTVYILECSDNTFYVGITSNIDLRLEQHKNGNNAPSYTYRRRPVTLKWFQNFTNAKEAIKFEKQLKGWSRAKKIALIEQDWDRLILYSKNHTDFGKPD